MDTSATVVPETIDDVSTAVRLANEQSRPVQIIGASTKAAPTSSSIKIGTAKIATAKINRVLEHTWQDLTCTVQAGCKWDALQSALAQHGQFVALDPLFSDRATVGGIIATNDSGSLRLKYGSLRDLVIGMTIVLADGTIAKSGGKVVKNVAGYDLHKLMIGAEGTLGVITEVTFRLHAIPRHTRSFTISAPTPEPLGQLLLAILNSHLSTQAMQLRNSSDSFHLDVQLAALPEVVEDESHKLAAMAQPLAFSSSTEDVWATRQTIASQSGICTLKATMLPTSIASAIAAIHALGGTAVVQASGIMTAHTPPNVKGLLQLRAQLEQSEGSLTILRDTPEGFDPWGKLPDTLPLMRVLKHRFDPNGILNPGRFIGGI